jgi:hypothetical protein
MRPDAVAVFIFVLKKSNLEIFRFKFLPYFSPGFLNCE